MLAIGVAPSLMRERTPPSFMSERALRESEINTIFSSASSTYLQEARDKLLEAGPSHKLLEADNSNDLLPSDLQRDANAAQFVFVDEPRCIGCYACSEVARSTFRMEEDFGAARVYQQRGDDAEVIEEAMLCCPVDCIHDVSFNELRVLEHHRQAMLEDGAMAAAQGAGKLSARAEGRDGAPNWRDPLRGMSLDPSGLEAPRTASAEDQQALDAGELGWEVLAALQGADDGAGGGSSSSSGSVEPEGVDPAAALFGPEAGYELFGDEVVPARRPMPDEKDVSDALFGGGYAEPVLLPDID